MADQPGVWGIDVGQCALKALRLEMIEGKVTATAFDYVEHPKILSQPDADPDQLTREALETFLSRNSIKGDQIGMSIAGQSGLARFVKLPPVEEKKIADIVRFEAKQQIPFPLDEVVWDYQKIGTGTVTDGFAMDTEIGLFAMKRDMINRFLHHFQSVDVEVHIVQMAPLALCNYVAYDLLKKSADGSTVGEEEDDETPAGKKRCAVALDVGTDGSSLIITDGGKIIWQRPIPIGGNHFTRALTKEMKLTFAKAEHLKRNAAKSPDLAKILKALKPVLTDFVNEVQRSLGYFTNTHRDAHIAYMVGLGSAFRLPGLQKFLAEKLALDVRKPSGFARLTGDSVVSAPVFTENLLSFPVAYGLALQGLGQSRLTTNLLPQEIQFDRKIRAKKPWMVAAAAALLLGAGVLTLGYGLKSRALGHPIDFEKYDDPIAKAMKEGKNAVGRAQAQNSLATTREGEVKKTTDDVRAIVAGKDERRNWNSLSEFVSDCVPKPDGTNLKEPFQTKYWNNTAAHAAYEQYRQRRLGLGNVVDVPLEEEALQNLATADVESVNCLFTDDLKDFYTKAKERYLSKEMGHQRFDESGIDVFQPTIDGQPKLYSEMLPEGAGWIVELRGHTYQKDLEFIQRTLVYNLNKMGFGSGLAPATLPPGTDPSTIDPIKGRISHAFEFFHWGDKEPQPGTFKWIDKSYLQDVMTGGTGGQVSAPGGPGGNMPSAMPFSPGKGMAGMGDSERPGQQGPTSRSAWAPLGPTSLGGGSGAGGTGGFPGAPGTERRGPSLSLGTGGAGGAGGALSAGGRGSSPAAPAAPGTDQPKSGQKQRTRYEFVVFLVWREPVLDASAAAAPTK
jgi:type IV pilus assembly protein PilM